MKAKDPKDVWNGLSYEQKLAAIKRKENGMIKKLVVKEFDAIEGDQQRLTTAMEKGSYKYSYFQDPKTGKYYRPTKKFTVTGEDLLDRFVEVEVVE